MTSVPRPLFDQALLGARLDRAWRNAGANQGADFLLSRAVADMVERLGAVKRTFGLCLDVGTPGPQAAAALAQMPGIAAVRRFAPTALSLGDGRFLGEVGDIEALPFAAGGADLIVSLLALQHVNDLPGAFEQFRRALRPDGLMIACLLGGDTLRELRQSLTIAESELSGGAAPRVAPFAELRALGGLLQRAGFALPVVDVEPITVRYDHILVLMRDLRAMGAANALHARSRRPLRRAILARAGEIYAQKFADPDGRLRASFEIIWLSGWAPHASQQKPLKPGAAAMRLADALKAGGG